MTTQNMQMVMNALKAAGLNDNQARILGAEIGRENGFQSKYLWGYHIDPKNGAKNIGLISWQGGRAAALEKELKKHGLIQNGKIVQSQEALNVQAKFLVNEIRTQKAYAQTKRLFLDNPNVDYATGNKVLGTNFIKWAYNTPKYANGHKNRDRYYKQLGGVIGNADAGNTVVGGSTQQATTPNYTTPNYTTPNYTTPSYGTPVTTTAASDYETQPTPLLKAPFGFAAPSTDTERDMFGDVLNANLSAKDEATSTVALHGISSALGKQADMDLFDPNPVSKYIASLFDKV